MQTRFSTGFEARSEGQQGLEADQFHLCRLHFHTSYNIKQILRSAPTECIYFDGSQKQQLKFPFAREERVVRVTTFIIIIIIIGGTENLPL